ncbi:hypothetical protein [Bosea massiliensis]|uniref:Uncharacterized protein n=1 Tax=Bosea massiliensis TaxID=151419 RepID=A0ABW0P1H6_9HYPH
MTDTNASNSAPSRAEDRAAAQAERLEAAKKTISEMRDYNNRIGIALPDIRVPTLNEKGDFFWKAQQLPIDGAALGQVVDRLVKEGKMGKDDPVKFDGGEVTRGENGRFQSFTVPLKAKMDNPVIQQAAFRTLMLDRGRQFLADKDNIAMLRNTARQPGENGGTKSVPLTGIKALVRKDDKAYYAFVDKDELLQRLDKSPKIAPYIADAVVKMNENYIARSERLKSQTQSVSKER